MNFEDVGRVWREQGTGDFQRRKIESLSAVRSRLARATRTIRRRDFRETVAALVMIPFFIRATLDAPSTLWAIGSTLVVLSCLFIPIRLWLARRRDRDATELSVREALEVEVERIRDQERLLSSVLLWYVAPPLTGILLMVLGGSVNAAGDPVSPRFRAVYAVIVVVLGWFVVSLNRRAVRLRLRPLREELESWLAGLEAFDYENTPAAESQGGTQ
jgi:positive regulator of sigma E activity